MKILSIGVNTVRETLHQPVVYVILVASVVLLAIVGQLPRFSLNIYDEVRSLKDLATGTAIIAGMLIAIFSAVHAVTSEIQNWTVITVLSKPVRRWEWVVGKFVGLAMMLGAVFVVMTILYTLVMWWGMWSTFKMFQATDWELMQRFWSEALAVANQMWRAMLLCYLQVLVLAALGVAFCVRAPMVVSVMAFFLVFVLGHFVRPLSEMLRQGGNVVGVGGAWLLRRIIPDLEVLNVSQEVGRNVLISPGYMGLAALFMAIYATAFVMVGVLLFRNREVI
jgi:ABC-type transport system involved in multi-copper enzyme maturation permease subunit